MSVTPQDPGDQAGFSAIEAIAALAILTVALLPLLELQANSARAAIAIERSAGELTAEHSALAFMEVLNPMRDPEGTMPLGRFTLHWQSEPFSEVRPAYQQDGSPGRFDMQLYTVTYYLEGPERSTRRQQVRKIGWKATKPVGFETG